jgi:hypothetical protein
MLNMGYFSHWNNLGYKPYMRYTLTGGTGYVQENVAFKTISPPPSGPGLTEVAKALRELEYDMMYRDQEWQDGHRDNILEKNHNRVSLGIAHGFRRGALGIYLVEDFEDSYIELALPFYSNGQVRLVGKKTKPINPDSITVFYDKPPILSKDEIFGKLKAYDTGVCVGGVTPLHSRTYFAQGLTVEATKWEQTESSIYIEFSVRQFFQKSGSGVYTIYLTEDDSKLNYTSLSIFS